MLSLQVKKCNSKAFGESQNTQNKFPHIHVLVSMQTQYYMVIQYLLLFKNFYCIKLSPTAPTDKTILQNQCFLRQEKLTENKNMVSSCDCIYESAGGCSSETLSSSISDPFVFSLSRTYSLELKPNLRTS